jgi:hypothetical protein
MQLGFSCANRKDFFFYLCICSLKIYNLHVYAGCSCIMLKNKSAKRFVSSNERNRRLVLKLSTSGVLVEKRVACGAIAFFDYAFTYPQHHL